MTPLSTLSTELLARITTLIDAEDIAYLWFSGDSLLNLHLRNGGVPNFTLEYPIAFPRLIAQLRLRSLLITSHFEMFSSPQALLGADVTLIGSTIEDLDLNFPTALALLDLSPTPMKTLFPNLRSLTLPENPLISDEFDWEVSRKVAIDKMTEDDERSFGAESKLFENLTTFDLLSDRSVRWYRIIPPSVLNFKWTSHGWENPTPLTAGDLANLPACLESLTVDPLHREDLKLFQHLPKKLQRLEFELFALNQLDSLDFVDFLPASLHCLPTPLFRRDLIDSVTPLPPLLENWPQYRTSLPLLPTAQKLRSLIVSVKNVEDTPLNLLLPSVRSLELNADSLKSLNTAGMDDSMLRLPNLTSLTCFGLKSLASSFLRLLPATLRHLRTSTGEFLYEAPLGDDNLRSLWPARLERSEISINREMTQPLEPSFWLSLPHHLKDLYFRMSDFTNMPDTSSFLPRTLTKLDLGCGSSFTPITDAFFMDLPKTLRYLSMEEFDLDLSSQFCLSLPRTMLSVNLVMYDSFWPGDEDIAAALCVGSSIDPNVLWNFIDKLPPLVELFPESSNKPDFAEWQSKRLEDDVCETCPNVAFSEHEAGVGRPNNIPRRKRT